MPTLLNKKFPFRSFGGVEPKAEEVRADLEDFAETVMAGQLAIGGQPGRGRPRYRIIANPDDTNPNGVNGSGGTTSVIPPGTIGTPSAEGGVYFVRMNGRRVFYQADRPSQGKEGDVWYDTDDNYRLYLFQDGEWVEVFSVIPEIVPTILGLDSRTYLAQLDDQVNAILAERTDRNAAIIHVQRTSESATEATAYDLSVLNAQVNDPTTGLPNSHARITTEQSVRANADGSAIASIVTALTAGTGGATITSGTVVIGLTYKITSIGTGIIVTNIGAPNNNLNTTFVATGTTPTAWNGGSLQETRLASIETWAVAKTSADASLAAEYVLNVVTGGASGRRVAGFRITNQGGAGGGTDFVIQTDKLTLVDTSGDIPTVPFEVTGGVVYIKEAVIKEVTAGKITAGTITAAVEMTTATLTAAKIRSASAVDFSTTTGFYMAVDGGTPVFRIGDPSGSRLSWNGTVLTVVSNNVSITGGTVTIGTGDNTVRIGVTGVASTTGLAVGDIGVGHYVQLAAGASAGRATVYLRKADGTIKGYFNYDGFGTTLAGGGGGVDVIQDFQTLNVQEVRALSSANTDDTSTALVATGGCYIGGKFRSVGIGYFNTTLNVSGVLFALSNAEVSGYLSVDGVCYGSNGSASGVAFAPRQDDVDSGMYSDETNKVKFAAGGSECFRIVNSSGTTYAIVSSGTILRLGNTKSAITTESLSSYITVQGSDGSTYKLAIVS